MPPRGLSRAIGERVKALRQGEGHSADELAEAARDLGVAWHRSTVAAIENGDRGLSAEELVALPLIFTLGLSRPVSWSELVGDGDAVQLGAELTLARSVVVDILTGLDVGQLTLGDLRSAPLRELAQAAAAATREALAWWQRAWPDAPPEQVAGVREDTVRDAEQTAARKLDVPAQVVAVAARRTWGRGLTDERDARVAAQTDADTAPRTVQAIRGHVTRRLLAEITPLVAEITAATTDEKG